MFTSELKKEFINNRFEDEPELREKVVGSLFAPIPPGGAANTSLSITETCRSPSCTSHK